MTSTSLHNDQYNTQEQLDTIIYSGESDDDVVPFPNIHVSPFQRSEQFESSVSRSLSQLAAGCRASTSPAPIPLAQFQNFQGPVKSTQSKIADLDPNASCRIRRDKSPPTASAQPSPSKGRVIIIIAGIKANAEIQAAAQAQQERNLSLLEVPKTDSPESDESGLELELDAIVKGFFCSSLMNKKRADLTNMYYTDCRLPHPPTPAHPMRMRARRSFSNTPADRSKEPLMGEEAREAPLGKEDAEAVGMILEEYRREDDVGEVVMENGFTFWSAIDSEMIRGLPKQWRLRFQV
ncbi:hypothetical protein BU17DRAFT_69399 [Hysterangium stoloniferum]|nr:hypothetical protein BU17DRAFT_69399 [Hysterangium stoloniferum]